MKTLFKFKILLLVIFFISSLIINYASANSYHSISGTVDAALTQQPVSIAVEADQDNLGTVTTNEKGEFIVYGIPNGANVTLTVVTSGDAYGAYANVSNVTADVTGVVIQ